MGTDGTCGLILVIIGVEVIQFSPSLLEVEVFDIEGEAFLVRRQQIYVGSCGRKGQWY